MKKRAKRIGLLLMLGVVTSSSSLACGASSTTLNDTQTIHNREATRIWVIRRNLSGDVTRDQVVFCDIGMVQAGRDLCTTWGQ